MSVKSKRKQWQREKQERDEFLRSFPIVRLVPQPDGTLLREEVAWKTR